MSLICFGTSKLEGNKQWQIPFGLFFIIPTFVASCIWFVPEVRRNRPFYTESAPDAS